MIGNQAHLLKEPPQCMPHDQWWTLEVLMKTQESSRCKTFWISRGAHRPGRITRSSPGPPPVVARPSWPCSPPLWTSRASLYDTSAKAWSGDRFSSFNTLARPLIPVLILHSDRTRKKTCKTILSAGRTNDFFSILRSCGCWRRFNCETWEHFSCNLEWIIAGRGERYDITKELSFSLGGFLAKLDRLRSFFVVYIILEWV